jgi:hypothetical protein
MSEFKGSKAGNWKGGRNVTKRGYVEAWVAPDDPFACMRKLPTCYVFEHRLVMARMLGRPLTDNESVHHRDGNRQNNDPTNLELWSRYQPSGQRVRDKLEWAREIIALYGDLPDAVG